MPPHVEDILMGPTRRAVTVLVALAFFAACGSGAEDIVVLTADGGVFVGQVESADGSRVVIRDAECSLHAIDRSTIVSMGQDATDDRRKSSPWPPARPTS